MFKTEQPLLFSRGSLRRGEFEMGHWVQERRGISVVHLQIALLILAVILAGAVVTFYLSTLPR